MTTATQPPLVAVVGRPNVGKSALFNRLTRQNAALVEDLPGTTRDRLYRTLEWNGRLVRLVDTGGLIDADDPFSPLIREGVRHALAEAQAVLFVVDAQTGPTAADYEIAEMLRRGRLPVLLVANKVDSARVEDSLADFYALGLGAPFAVSALHGRGTGDLLDEVVRLVAGLEAGEEEAGERIQVAIVGRPNVGKSSLTNAILGQERVIVSDVPGTTRDAIDTPFTFEGHDLLLVDTAGIRRRGKVERGVERHSVQRAERAVDRADVVVLVIDQAELVAAQDTHIAGYASKQGKGIILAVNKWDLAEDRALRPDVAHRVDHRYRFIPWAPVLFTSAKTGEGVRDLLESIVHVAEGRTAGGPTTALNRVIHRAMAEHGPATVRHKRLKVLYATQAEVAPPTFVFFVNDPTIVHFSYRRFLENRIREAFDFEGTAIRMTFRRRSEDRFEESA
jgi:GTP-binding protein